MDLKRTLTLLPAAALLLTGCGTDDSRGTGSRDDTGDPATSSTSAAATVPDRTSSAPVTTIPADLELPHESSWYPVDDGPGWPLPQVCVDPTTRQAGPAYTDRRGVSTTDEDGLPGEYLALYADPADAEQAVAAWRTRTEECGGPGSTSHTGEPTAWTLEKTSIDGADEGWQAYEQSESVGGEDLSQSDPFVTVARVGNAVYVESYIYPGQLDDAAIATREEAGVDSVEGFLSELSRFA